MASETTSAPITPPPLPWSGGCQCGSVRYRVVLLPLTLYACHCRACQCQSSSAFGMSMRLPVDALQIDWRALSAFRRDKGERTEVECFFCPGCGVRLVHRREGRETINLKPGTLDDPSWLRVVGHLWTDRAQPFVAIAPDLLSYPRQPDGYDDLIAAWQARMVAPSDAPSPGVR